MPRRCSSFACDQYAQENTQDISGGDEDWRHVPGTLLDVSRVLPAPAVSQIERHLVQKCLFLREVTQSIATLGERVDALSRRPNAFSH